MIKKKPSKKISGSKYPKPKLFKPTKKQTKDATKRLVKESLHKDNKSHNVKINVLSGVNKWHKELQTLSYDIIRHHGYKDNLEQALKNPKFKKAVNKKTFEYKAIKNDLAQTNAYIKFATSRYRTLLTLLGKPIG